MSLAFTKLFSSIVTSTVWQEASHVRIVWVTMLALADRGGRVGASIPGLARIAGVTMAECEEALARFLSPDPYSRTRDHEGRRIAVTEGGWQLLNHAKYRALGAGESASEAQRERKRRYWDRHKDDLNARRSARRPLGAASNPLAGAGPYAEAEAEAEKKEISPRKPKRPRTPLPESWSPSAALAAVAREEGRDCEREAKRFRDHALSSGRLAADWDAAFRNWLRSEHGRGSLAKPAESPRCLEVIA